MKRVYVDCNILIDWLLEREPYSLYAAKLIELTETGEIKSYVSAVTLAITYYIIKKALNQKVADEFLKDSLSLFSFADIRANTITKAINNKYRDFEDDLHYYAAIDQSIEYLITRNKKDFRQEGIELLDAEQFVKRHSK